MRFSCTRPLRGTKYFFRTPSAANLIWGIEYGRHNGFIGKLKLCVVRMYRSLMPLNAEFSYKKLSEKDVIQNHSRGNVLLQLGRITTAEEFEALRAKVIKYEF